MSPCSRQRLHAELGHVSHSEFSHPARARRRAIPSVFRHGLPYSKTLSAHTSCVNTLAFSNGDGRWLASGGDDPTILLWDFHQDNVAQPSHKFIGPKANVFALAFSATNQYLYSGDTDNVILQYDLSRLPAATTGKCWTPNYENEHHTDTIRAISCHPEQNELFLSASEDGCIILHDTRIPTRHRRAVATLQHSASFNGVQYHPIMHNLFATADQRGALCLRDVRMAFGPLTQRSNEGIVQTYVTTISKPSISSHMSNPEISSITFNTTGTKLAATMLHFLPTIYSINDPFPVATCSGKNLPDGTAAPQGEKTYSNSTTIKHGSFGGPTGDEYYSAGSDDFRAYIWELPSLSTLLERRETIEFEKWSTAGDPDMIGFTTGMTEPCVPVEIDTPLCRLAGHKSIVNTTLMHPHLLHTVTAGIERHIVLHSPTPISPCADDMHLTPTNVRAVPDNNLERRHRAIRLALGLEDPNPDADDEDAIALFDEIVRSEGNGDVFQLRQWNPDMAEDDDDDTVGDDGFLT
ncbi:WD40 repeat-like protein [Obba rivulosa]|uniref:WD40 repeat-like protein n=1 Tax=Obba rivulosa TaxID=1052685 RepID=A0A8E2B5T4_9APHY|nr:WD40 repeat-like protein [Obba rivulosa]